MTGCFNCKSKRSHCGPGIAELVHHGAVIYVDLIDLLQKSQVLQICGSHAADIALWKYHPRPHQAIVLVFFSDNFKYHLIHPIPKHMESTMCLSQLGFWYIKSLLFELQQLWIGLNGQVEQRLGFHQVLRGTVALLLISAILKSGKCSSENPRAFAGTVSRWCHTSSWVPWVQIGSKLLRLRISEGLVCHVTNRPSCCQMSTPSSSETSEPGPSFLKTLQGKWTAPGISIPILAKFLSLQIHGFEWSWPYSK